MRILHPDLLAAQKSASAVPYVEVHVSERIGNVRRLRWQRLYTGGEPDYHHAATMPADGSLLRARVNPGDNKLYYQRVTSPGEGSDFSGWTLMANVSASAGIAMTSQGATVLLFYVSTDGVTILVRESGDNGATFGAPNTADISPGAAGWLASALKSDGTALLVYSVGGTVYRVKRVSGAWGSASAWTHSAGSISGLACHHSGDFNLAVTGTDTAGAARAWTVVYGDGFDQATDTWSGLMELTGADAGSGMEFRSPSLAKPEVYRQLFVEKYSGSESYSRPLWTHLPQTLNFKSNAWREPVPFDLASAYGMAQASGGGYVWLSTASGVWRAEIPMSALDVTGDIVELTAEAEGEDGRLRVVLRNDDGRYSDLSSGEYALIRRGSQVDVSPGYVTPSGPLASYGPSYWIDGWEYVTGEGRGVFVLHARDAWSLLDAWRARRQYSWAPGEENVFLILEFLFGRAGLEFTSRGNSDTMTTLKPGFTIHPGESGKTAVRRLLAMVPDLLMVLGEYGYVINPLASDPADYDYGVDHAILRARYGTLTPDFNRAQAYGFGVTAERFDWDGVEDVYDRLRQVQDVNLTTAAMAGDRADAMLRKAALGGEGGEIVVPVNCGQELYDVVSVSDVGAGLAAAKRRVMGMVLRYSTDARSPAYEQRIRLGAV
jgi:hypothetical protein